MDAAASTSALAGAADFAALNAQLEQEKELGEKLREQAKVLERSYRRITSHLNGMHSTPAAALWEQLIAPTVPMFAQVRAEVGALAELVPPHRYYQWNQTFDWQIKNLTSCAALACYLGTGRLLSKAEAQRVIGVSDAYADRLLLSTEDYLVSLTVLTNELSRLAVTSVTLGDFATPLTLSRFVKDLHAGFQLLNLKNNELRRRFDSIKYDVKKIEEVVYDITLRGLVPAQQSSAATVPGLRDDRDPAQAQKIIDLLASS